MKYRVRVTTDVSGDKTYKPEIGRKLTLRSVSWEGIVYCGDGDYKSYRTKDEAINEIEKHKYSQILKVEFIDYE